VVVATNSPYTIPSGVTNASPTPTYQWYYYGALMTNQTNSSIVFGSIQSSNAGCYSVVVSNVFGIVTNKCCVIVDPPVLRYQADWLSIPPLCNVSAALLPGTILQLATNVTPLISWQNVVTNDSTNCNFQYSSPMFDTNGDPVPQCFFRTRKP
jgi:hypothetical protein